MIEYIKGEIVDLTPTYCVLETNGIGYMLNVSLVTYQESPSGGCLFDIELLMRKYM